MENRSTEIVGFYPNIPTVTEFTTLTHGDVGKKIHKIERIPEQKQISKRLSTGKQKHKKPGEIK